MKTKELVFNAILIGMIFIMAWVPQLGYINIFGFVGITIIHIPVLIGALVYKKSGLVLGTAFGLSSIMIAFIRPTTPIDLLFQNPLVSVLPRMIFGFSIYYIYQFSNKLIKNSYVSTPITMIISTLWHSVLVLGALYIFGLGTLTEVFGTNSAGIRAIIWTILTTNSLVEAIVAAVAGTAIAKTLDVVIKRNEF